MEDNYKWNGSSRGRSTTNGDYNRPRYNQEGDATRSPRSGRPRFQSSPNGVRAERVERSGYSRPRYDQGGDYSQGPRTGRPRFNPNGTESGYRPRYNDNQEGGYSRPRYNQDARPAGRPRFNQEGEYSRPTGRPRFNQEGEFRSPRAARPQGNVYSKRKRFEYQEKHTDPNKPMRLNKYLANAGICSRREADDFIQAGVITVNGEVVTTLGAKVLPTDRVMFHDQAIRRESKVYILLNKPKNCVTTTDDPQERKTVIDIVKNACAERIYPVGRLDRNTTGVLLLTNDGDLAAKLTHPKYGKKKIYAVTIDKDLTPDDFATIMQGVVLDDELIVPDALEFTKEGSQRHIGLEIHSGQNRVVRRIFEKVGYKVLHLDRVSFAGLTKKNVARGKYRFLTPKEVSMLQMGAFE